MAANCTMATDGTARVATTALRLTVPDLSPERTAALLAVVERCTVHNTLERPPEVTFDVVREGTGP
ncbi:hypothetical protein [Actinacidiphila soli]|uniref:hypothetical protein n=1 Tax=Actinacidiphila soli TaxID=2487275 RepID=UPI000FCA5977|nr:hypothetical protein [Actinacidiphila soli]